MFNMFIGKIIPWFGSIRPIWLRKKWFSFFHTTFSLIKRLFRIFSEIRSPVFLVSGVGRTSKEPLQLLFVNKDSIPFFLFHKLFDSDPDFKIKGKTWIWDCSKLKQKCNSEVSGIIVSCDRFLNRFLQDKGWFVIPHWVSMWFDSSKEFSVLLDELPRSAKYDVKHMEKKNFSFIITKDLRKIRFFYDEMYLPLISSNVIKDEAYIADFLFFLLRYYKGYELMMILDGKKEIAGVFFFQKNETLFLEYAGVYHGDRNLIKKGALSTIYYYSIKLAKKLHVKKIDFGGVRPFFNDGLFQYKRKWGMSVEPYDIVTDITGFSIEKDSNELYEFLTDNSFIGLNKNEELVWHVFNKKKEINDESKKDYVKKMNTAGVKDFCFIEL